jgi:hypothetical protein
MPQFAQAIDCGLETRFSACRANVGRFGEIKFADGIRKVGQGSRVKLLYGLFECGSVSSSYS